MIPGTTMVHNPVERCTKISGGGFSLSRFGDVASARSGQLAFQLRDQKIGDFLDAQINADITDGWR